MEYAVGEFIYNTEKSQPLFDYTRHRRRHEYKYYVYFVDGAECNFFRHAK